MPLPPVLHRAGGTATQAGQRPRLAAMQAR
jgi:hypothetical protein